MDPIDDRGVLGQAPHRCAVAALERRGAEVRVFPDAENCVRRREPHEPPGPPYVIEVQGVPNLFHELAHVALLGRVEKDHATEYARIPFDVATPHGRRLLFEELACCLASCDWHPGSDADAHAWFAEQIGIQHVFFGFDGDRPGFLAAADAVIREHRAELEATITRARAGVEAALRDAGAIPAGAVPHRTFAFETAWRRQRGG